MLLAHHRSIRKESGNFRSGGSRAAARCDRRLDADRFARPRTNRPDSLLVRAGQRGAGDEGR